MKLIDNVQKTLYNFVMGGAPMETIYDKDVEEYNVQLENEIWYEGDATKLNNFYSQFNNSRDVKYNYFWSKSFGYDHIRKIHSGLPAMIVDKLIQITIRDGYSIIGTKENEEYEEGKKNEVNDRLQIILDDNNFEEMLKESLIYSLVNPGGAFKISSDPDITDYPILEYVKAKNVELVYKRGRLFEVIFKSYYEKKSKEYCLYERYGKGYIKYELYEVKNNELTPVELGTIEETQEYAEKNGIDEFKNDIIYAIPTKVYENSIFAKKKDIFDALDEVLSIMGDSVRDSRTERYIPEDKLDTDTRTGKVLMPDGFDSRYIVTKPNGKEVDEKIQTVQPDIKFQGYTATFKNYVDQALLGILSPTTLGLDKSNGDRNAQDRREQEKTSIFTRTDIIRSLENIIYDLGKKLLQAEDEIKGKTPGKYDVSVEFGEYASLSFEDRVNTMAKAKQADILPYSVIIEELYGDNKTDEQKEEIVKELMQGNINIDFNDMLPEE